MRSLLLADRDLALRESALLHRLLIGLLDAGTHVTLAAPEQVLGKIDSALGVAMLPYRVSGLILTRTLRARELLDRFFSATAVSSGEPGIVHVFGAEALPLAEEVAALGGLGIVVDVHSRVMVARAAAVEWDPSSTVLLAGSAGLAAALLASGVPGSIVRERPWGVTGSPTPRGGLREGRSVSIAVGGGGGDRAAWANAVRGIAQAAGHSDDLAVFMDADASDHAGVGALVGSLGLSPLVSRVPDFESRRALVVQADILLWPERLGEVRSVVLDGMASEMAVIAVEDPDAPALGSRGPARLVAGDPAGWAEAIGAIVADTQSRRNLGAACAAYVAEHHRSASHISGVFDAYERLCGWLGDEHEGAGHRP